MSSYFPQKWPLSYLNVTKNTKTLDFILTQYADDTTVILDGSEDSLKETLYELEEFAKRSGLKVNFWIGSKNIALSQLKQNGNYNGELIDLNYWASFLIQTFPKC